MFINKLNKNNKNNKIIKLLGNHEINNIITPFQKEYEGFIFTQDNNTSNYHNNVSRRNIFNVGNYGFKLLLEGGCGILIKINNTVFVHGNLLNTYNEYEYINNYINNKNNNNQTEWNNMIGIDKENIFYNSLDNRDRGFHTDSKTDGFCNGLNMSFKKFINYNNNLNTNAEDMILVIGHCVQSNYTIYYPPEPKTTYRKDDTFDDLVCEKFSKESYTGDYQNDNDKIFGITMDCNNTKDKYKYNLYRVDIGVSRAFDDNNIMKINNISDEQKYLYSRTPQILNIDPDGNISIFKSKMKNTRIHLKRPLYEDMINNKNITELKLEHNHYNSKYLKYKTKYLQLKKYYN
jgi:hypothetical protein